MCLGVFLGTFELFLCRRIILRSDISERHIIIAGSITKQVDGFGIFALENADDTQVIACVCTKLAGLCEVLLCFGKIILQGIDDTQVIMYFSAIGVQAGGFFKMGFRCIEIAHFNFNRAGIGITFIAFIEHIDS